MTPNNFRDLRPCLRGLPTRSATGEGWFFGPNNIFGWKIAKKIIVLNAKGSKILEKLGHFTIFFIFEKNDDFEAWSYQWMDEIVLNILESVKNSQICRLFSSISAAT